MCMLWLEWVNACMHAWLMFLQQPACSSRDCAAILLWLMVCHALPFPALACLALPCRWTL